MGMYILLVIGFAAVPFFLYCLWHVLRDMNPGKKSDRQPLFHERETTPQHNYLPGSENTTGQKS
jgi:hypothetical protein